MTRTITFECRPMLSFAMMLAVMFLATTPAANASSIEILATFTNAPIEISAVGDTSNRQVGFGGFFIPNNSASITIGGIGTLQFVSGTAFFSCIYSFCPPFVDLINNPRGGDLVFGPISDAVSFWTMLTSIGPIAGSGNTQTANWFNGYTAPDILMSSTLFHRPPTLC